MAAEQAHSAEGAQAALAQLQERCADLREAASGHEERARGAAAEAAKASRALDKLTASAQPMWDTACTSSAPGEPALIVRAAVSTVAIAAALSLATTFVAAAILSGNARVQISGEGRISSFRSALEAAKRSPQAYAW